MNLASFVVSLLSLALGIWALLKARRAKKVAEQAVRLVARHRLATAFAHLEHAVEMVGVARLHDLVQLFILIAHEWRPIAAEVRALARRVDSESTQLLTVLSEVNALMDMAREQAMTGSTTPLAVWTSSLARRLTNLTDLVVESRIALEYLVEDK